MFFTLLERKILRYSQFRIGPNKISFINIIQPLLDGIKLIINEKINSFKYNKFLFFLGPFILFLIIIIIWLVIPYLFSFIFLIYSVLFFIVCLGLSVYRSLIRGWASNSKFSIIGAIRRIAQTLSYELTIIFRILRIFFFFNSLYTSRFWFLKRSYFFFLLPIILTWIINILRECGRAPFDFIEGERELVRGFNTEFSRRSFALLFVGEYGIIIFFSIIRRVMFFYFNDFYVIINFWFFLIFFLLIRSSFPRFRYDFLIDLAWKKILPFRIFFLLFSFILNI